MRRGNGIHRIPDKQTAGKVSHTAVSGKKKPSETSWSQVGVGLLWLTEV